MGISRPYVPGKSPIGADPGLRAYLEREFHAVARTRPGLYTSAPYDVRNSRVVGDGSADDTTALRAAVSAAGPYAWVYFPHELECLISGAIVDASLAADAVGQTWFGGGKLITADGFNHHVFDLNGITDFTALGLRAESGTLGAAYSAATARFFRAHSGANRCRMLRCHVTGFQSAAQFNGATHCAAIGCTIVAPFGWGVNVQTGAHYARVLENDISAVANEHGVYVSGSSGNLILAALVGRNTVDGAAVDGFKLTYCKWAKLIENLSQNNGGEGFYATIGTERADIAGNTSQGNGGSAVLVFDSTAATVYVLVRHNFLGGSGSGRSLNLQQSGAGSVTACKLAGNMIADETTAIYVGAGVSDTVIDDNEFLGTIGTTVDDNGTGTDIRQAF